MSEKSGPLAVSVKEAARRLGISAPHAYNQVRDGSIPSVKLGERVIVPVKGLEKLVEIK